MKVIYDSVSDTIISFGPNLEGDNVYQAPLDYSFDKYDYHSEVQGVFNPNGFTIKPPQPQTCFFCGHEVGIDVGL